MLDPQTILLFLGAALTLNLTPGPDMLYVIARSTGDGRVAGITSALGIGAGTLVHIAAVALGVASLLAATPVAYAVVRWCGAAYLVWLGIRTWRQTRADTLTTHPPAPLRTIFFEGMATNVLNPKVALFFLAFLPQFVDPGSSHAVAQVIVLGLLFDTSGTLVNLGVALGASHLMQRHGPGGARMSSAYARWLRRCGAILFVGLGLRLAFGARP